jgi:hypothetical protein
MLEHPAIKNALEWGVELLMGGPPAIFLMQACTIVARNYLAQARVLARSFQKHHPGRPFTILLVDDAGGGTPGSDGLAYLGLRDLGLAPGEAQRMALIYNVVELSTALKPWLLRRLLQSGPEVALYFDPDIEIFAPLSDIAELARERSIVLTPHVLEPIPRDALRPTETDIMAAGIYNLGFLAVGPGSEPFLDWWAVRLRRECIIDPGGMRFTDQRWIDFVPALFPHHILRDPTCNVAYWNLDHRRLAWTGEGYEINGRPLRFFHYSGYDPNYPDVLSKFQGGAPRVNLREEPPVAKICDEYSRKLTAEDYARSKREPYGYNSFGDGFPVDHVMRAVYRNALMKSEAGEGPEPPNPFNGKTDAAFLEWLNEPQKSVPALITRYMIGLHNVRPDVQNDFPVPLGRDVAAFHEWFVNQGRYEEECHPSLVPATHPNPDSTAVASRRLEVLKRSESVIGKVIDFGARGDSERYRLSGWSRAEPEFTWSARRVAQVALPVLRAAGALELQAVVGAFIYPPDLVAQSVEVYSQGQRVAEWTVGQPELFRAAIPAEATEDGGPLIIELRMPDACSPRKVLHTSIDPRILGVRVHSLQLVSALTLS